VYSSKKTISYVNLIRRLIIVSYFALKDIQSLLHGETKKIIFSFKITILYCSVYIYIYIFYNDE